MQMRVSLVVMLVGLLGLAACGGGSASLDTGRPGPGSASRLAAPTLSGVGGKFASGAPAGIFVRWTRNTEAEAAGYYLYRDTSPIPDPPVDGLLNPGLRVNGGAQVPQPPSGTHVNHNDAFTPVIGQRYYYRVTVVDTFGNESYPSNEMSWLVHGQSVATLDPLSAYWGDTVTITGDTFGAYNAATDFVHFEAVGGLFADGNIVSWTDTEIQVEVPFGAKTAPVYVDVNGTLALTDDPLTILNPYIDGLSPEVGFVEQQLLITGSGYGATQGSSTVTMDGADVTSAVFEWSDSRIALIVPATAAAGDVVVTVNGEASNGYPFTPRPEILAITPVNASVGESLTITGRNFGTAPGSGTFNGGALDILSWSDTEVQTTVIGQPGLYSVVLTDAAGLVSNTRLYEVGATLSATISGIDEFHFYTPDAPLVVQLDYPADTDSVRFIVDGVPHGPVLTGLPTDAELDFSGLTNGTHNVQIQVTRRAVTAFSNVLPLSVYTLIGDVDGSGSVDAADTAALLPLLGQRSGEHLSFRPWFDTDGDGVVTEKDAALIGYVYGSALPTP